MFRLSKVRRVAPLPLRGCTHSTRRRITTSSPSSPSEAQGHLPHSSSPIVPQPEFFNSVIGAGKQIPTFRILDGSGTPIDGAEVPEIDEKLARRLYENMVLLPTVDNILYNVQRQGKISFYMTSYGEEATIIGSAAALAPDDEVLGQYREMGVLLWRGFGLNAVMAQCFGNEEDKATRGRQMPMHFGSPELHFHTISSPLGTQIPQAAGVGYALKRDPKRRGKNVAAVFFGEGAASEGDFHAGMLLSSTIPAPVVFIARNNGFAISTPASEQFFGDGIASRGPAYGVDTIRVDGNDILAVYTAVQEARKRSLADGRGVLVEAMTYRVGHHSTSDDSFAYRGRQEVEDRKRIDNPILRFKSFLEWKGWWSEEEEQELKARLKAEVLTTFRRADSLKKGPVDYLFKDVYGGEEPWNIREQREELAQLLEKYRDWEPYRTELAKHNDKGTSLRAQVGK